MKFKVDPKILKNWPKYQLQRALWETWKKLSLQGLSLKPEEIMVEHPENEGHGDYAANIALAIFAEIKNKKEKRKNTDKKFKNKFTNPLALAQELKGLLEEKKLDFIEKIEVAPPGFINFWLKKEWLSKELEKAVKSGNDYGKSPSLKNKKIMVEYTDPNPFKEFHLGHLYSNIVGESLAKFFETQQAVVKRANYQGDVGMHVAKCLYGILKNKKLNIKKKKHIEKIKNFKNLKTLNEKVNFLGKCYVVGNKAYEEDEKAKEEIKEINYLIYVAAQNYLRKKHHWQPQVNYRKYLEKTKFDLEEIEELYNQGKAWSLAYFETIYKRLGTKFDFYYFESLAGEYGVKIVKEYLKKRVFEKSKGAIVFPGEKYGLHKRVFINSMGLPTYEAKDLGLVPTKYQDFAYDSSIIVTGSEIDAYFQVVLAALRQINPDLWKKTKHLSHGMVRLPEGKISSRTGKVLTGEWLIDEVKKRVLKLVSSEERMFGEKEKKIIAEKVGLGAIKYALLKGSLGNDVVFDFEKSISLEGNSGPYLQYTYARARSVLAKSKVKSPAFAEASAGSQKLKVNYNYKFNEEELAVLRSFYKFPEVILQAAENFAPNLVCNFVYDLAQRYNTFYNKHRILKIKNQKSKIKNSGNNRVTMNFRLLLTASTAQILKNGLNLLGIKVLERM